MITTPAVLVGLILPNRVIIILQQAPHSVQGESLNCFSSTHQCEKILPAHFEKPSDSYRNENNRHASSRPSRRLPVEDKTAAASSLKPSPDDQLKASTLLCNRSASVPEDDNEWLSATPCYSIHYGRGGLRPDPCSTSPTTRWRISGPSTEERHDIRNWKLSPTSFFRWHGAN